MLQQFLTKPRDKEGRKVLFGFQLFVRSLALSRRSLAQITAPMIWIFISWAIYFTTEFHCPSNFFGNGIVLIRIFKFGAQYQRGTTILNDAFIRFLTYFATVRYFRSYWAYQWNSPAVQDSRGMALTISMVWRVSVFSWQYFYKAQSGQKKENERRNHWRICWDVVDTRPVWRVFSAENSVDWRRTWYWKNHLL